MKSAIRPRYSPHLARHRAPRARSFCRGEARTTTLRASALAVCSGIASPVATSRPRIGRVTLAAASELSRPRAEPSA